MSDENSIPIIAPADYEPRREAWEAREAERAAAAAREAAARVETADFERETFYFRRAVFEGAPLWKKHRSHRVSSAVSPELAALIERRLSAAGWKVRVTEHLYFPPGEQNEDRANGSDPETCDVWVDKP